MSVVEPDRSPREALDDRHRRARTAMGLARQARRHRSLATPAMVALLVLLAVVALSAGRTIYSLDEVARVILGEPVPGASFTVGELRLPRAVLAMLSGLSFGIAGVTFQTLLRNTLASPDVVGISDGAGAAAVFGIVVLSSDGPIVSVLALGGALTTATVICLLSKRGGFTGTRLILIGIGIAAVLQSTTSYLLSRAANWDLQTAMQWLTGSLNNASWGRIAPLALAVAVALPLLLAHSRALGAMQIGDEFAASVGIRVMRTRLVLILGAVALMACATAATGPISFVAFLAGPIAARITKSGAILLIPGALVGAILVIGGDLIGQFAFSTRYPVGVVTGMLGAPYLLYLLARSYRP